jgi:hypothetical protein
MWRAVVISVVALLASGCLMLAVRPDMPPGRFSERTITISLEGTPGLPFEGSYGTPSGTTSARGVVPAQYSVKTSVAVVAAFTKSVEEGQLIIRLLVDGKETQNSSTSAPYGNVVIQQRF